MTETARPYSPTALPPVGARVLAFVAIIVGGLCGGLIGWSFVDLQCDGEQQARGGSDDPHHLKSRLEKITVAASSSAAM